MRTVLGSSEVHGSRDTVTHRIAGFTARQNIAAKPPHDNPKELERILKELSKPAS